MADIEVTIKSNRKEYERALEEVAERVLHMWGGEGARATSDIAPYDTGLLRNSITYALAGEKAEKSSYKDDVGKKTGMYSGTSDADKSGAIRSVHIGTNVEYAMSQEVGNFKDGPHAYLRPGIESQREHFKEILQGELEKAMSDD